MFALLSIVDRSLNTQQFYSGWLLIFVLTILLLFYAKKRLSILPIGRSSTWAQWHYYLGLFLLAVFLKHIEFDLPNGKLEVALSLLLIVTILTGLIGGVINRLFARRLSYLDEEVIYERITLHRNNVKEKAEHLLLETTTRSNSDTLAKYYSKHLHRFFSKPHNFWSHVLNSNYSLIKMQRSLELQLRYMNEYEAGAVFRLRGLIAQKDMLDRHYALQSVLKFWGILHMPIGLIVLLLVIVHVVLVYAFRGAS